MRPPKPDFLVQWEEWIKLGPPRCCHTCDHYGGRGECFEFNLIPPPEFAATQDCCPVYAREVPF